MSNPRLESGELTLVSELDGREVVLSGKVKNVRLTRDVDYENLGSLYLDKIYKTDERYSIEFALDPEKGSSYQIKVEGTDITHTARVKVNDRTLEEFERARKRAGAPESAKMRFAHSAYSIEGVESPLDKPMPGEVEFYWKETVYT